MSEKDFTTEDLIAGLKSGKYRLERGDGEISLVPATPEDSISNVCLFNIRPVQGNVISDHQAQIERAVNKIINYDW
jgi:hypothetical protein